MKKAKLNKLIEAICQELEPTEEQKQAAESHYNAVGKWLSDSQSPFLDGASVYAQGSIALGTIIKPIGKQEYDVDLVCRCPAFPACSTPAELKNLVGARLKENAVYRNMLEEKSRCWRLNYAGEFHMDCTPSIRDPAHASNGELIPDKPLKIWKPTNPKGYRDWFEKMAAIDFKIKTFPDFSISKMQADVEPFPNLTKVTGVLRRTIQIIKRHRDIYFEDENADLAPISIIITTLAARSYEFYALREHATEFDLLTTTVSSMNRFIEPNSENGKTPWRIPNPTDSDENFAERWNQDERLATAYFDWQKRLAGDLKALETAEGPDSIYKNTSKAFGYKVAARILPLSDKDSMEVWLRKRNAQLRRKSS